MIKKIHNIFFSKDFLLFLIIGIINTFNGVILSMIYSKLFNANIAFIIGYITSNIIAYFLNTLIIFKDKLGIKKYIKFFISYIPNFIIQNISVIIIYNWLKYDEIIAYLGAAIIGIPITFLLVKFFAFNKKH